MTKFNTVALIGAFFATVTSFSLALASFPMTVLTV
tara:strand:+ start:9089 stop:9193 length:105 start_codon:yes stop_codon:yes gene_type:complete